MAALDPIAACFRLAILTVREALSKDGARATDSLDNCLGRFHIGNPGAFPIHDINARTLSKLRKRKKPGIRRLKMKLGNLNSWMGRFRYAIKVARSEISLSSPDLNEEKYGSMIGQATVVSFQKVMIRTRESRSSTGIQIGSTGRLRH